jgi:hypothetical protein
METKTISQFYLLHFIYVPISLIYAASMGEDQNTILFSSILVILVSIITFLFNLFFTLIFKKMIQQNDSVIPFLLPAIMTISFKYILNVLDFGGAYGFLIIVLGSLIINIFTWSRLKLIKTTRS